MKKKLKNNDGMSIVIAMVVFLVSAIISLAIVGISLNNAQQVGRQFEEQQANLAISSAASFFEKLFDGVSAGCTNDEGWQDWEFDYGESKLGEDEYDGFREAFEEAFFNKKGVLDESGKLDWRVEGLEVDSKKPLDVIVRIEMKNKNLVVTLAKAPNSGADPDAGDDKYFQILNFKAGEFTDSDGTEEYYKEYTWNYVSLER